MATWECRHGIKLNPYPGITCSLCDPRAWLERRVEPATLPEEWSEIAGDGLERARAAGFTHVKTWGGPVALDDWRPYNKTPAEHAPGLLFYLDGDALRERQVPERAVGGVAMTGYWRLVR